jgi:hypothetical protein
MQSKTSTLYLTSIVSVCAHGFIFYTSVDTCNYIQLSVDA